MRVTEGMLQSTMVARMRSGYARMADASGALASGRRIDSPADDPTAAFAARRIDHEMHALEDMQARAQAVSGRLTPAEAALGEAADLVLRARELAVTMANGTYTAAERQGAAVEVRELRETLLGLANTRVNGTYVFGGCRESTPPFAEDGTYAGDGGAREVEVAPGLQLEATVTADGVFTAGAGGIDVLAELDALAAALDANDADAIATFTETLELGRDQLTAARADVGARLGILSRAEALTDRFQDTLSARRSDLVDTDVAATAMELASAEQALQAAVSVGQRLMEPTVLRMLM